MLKMIIIDFKINSFRSGIILLAYRLLNYFHVKSKSVVSRIFLRLLNMIWEVTKIILNINCQISYMATIGSNIRLPHIAEGVIISPKAEIGNYVTIFHQVTIGINESLSEEKQAISIGDGCYISAGAKIISCKIGKNVKIGPNAVVYKNIEDNSRVFSENHYN